MASLRCEALLLRSTPFGESDRVVHLLTPDAGRLAAMAKGARRSVRRFPGTLDLFNHLRVHLERRRRGSMARLEHAALLSPFLSLRADPRRFALASYLLELYFRLAPESGVADDAARLFRVALDSLRAIEGGRPDSRLRVLLELRALDAVGLRPQLLRCVRCNRRPTPTASVRFCVPDGGVLCAECSVGREGLLEIHVGTLRALDQALSFDVNHLGRLSLTGPALRESLHLVGRFGRFHVGVEMRSERFLGQMLGS